MVKPQSVVRPSFSDESDLENVSDAQHSSDDEMSTLSFGALSAAQNKILQEERAKSKQKVTHVKTSSKPKNSSSIKTNSLSDSETKQAKKTKDKEKKSKNKHAPSETSAKKKVSRVREIEGLGNKYKEDGLYKDIRFDTAYGKADLAKVRKDYAFLDDYRKQEIDEMKAMLKDKKTKVLLDDNARADLNYRIQSLQSRLDTMKNRDLENKIVSNFKKEQLTKFNEGKISNPYFLKNSEKRKMIQKARFDNMKSGQREKAMERKRKRRLGKEFRELEFNRR